jgi:hypothetical protein
MVNKILIHDNSSKGVGMQKKQGPLENMNPHIKPTQEQLFLKSFEQRLRKVINLTLDVSISNSTVSNKSIIAHQVLLEESKRKILMFAEGFRQSIFSNTKVIKAFKGFIKKILEGANYDKKEPCLELIAKKDKNELIKELENSLFIYELRKEFGEKINDIISISYINPKKTITLNNKISVKDSFASLEFTVNDTKDFLTKIIDINTFQIFPTGTNSNCIRVRKAYRKNHKSEAVINCGRTKEVNQLKNIFNKLKNISTKINLENKI